MSTILSVITIVMISKVIKSKLIMSIVANPLSKKETLIHVYKRKEFSSTSPRLKSS
jgi:hypothetical protein